jgi:regulator of Ty1 transposition protein 109
MLSLQARVQELEALVSQQDGKLSVNKEELEAAQVAAESREERIEFFRGLFNEASQKAGDFARENTALESRNATLKEQLDVGLKQQKLHYEAVNRRAEAERIKLEHQLAFLLEQNRATGDSVRHRAIQYPKLQKKHQNLVEAHMKLQKELRVSKKTNRQLQHDLDMLGPSDDSEEPYDSDQDVEAYPGPEDLRNRGYPVQPRKQSGASEIAQPHLMEGSMALVMPEPSNEVGSPNYPDFVHAEGPNVEESGEADANIGTLDLPQEHIPDASSSLTPEDKHKSGLLSFLKSSFAAAKLPLELRIDVIQSGHRRLTETTHVFPYTDVRHRILESRILVTVTGQATGNMTQDEQAPLLLSALEARVYTLPNKATTMVYISKVDSSGYSALPARYKPPAITSCLTRSFLRYYLSQQTRPTPRVFCHLFARAQKQYLFANSSDGGEKKVLSGLGLCKWWRNVFERVATELQQETTAGTQDVESPDRIQLQCWLPGAEPAEAKNMMGSTGDSSASHLTWSYNPPFGDTQATPMYNPEDTVRQLAYLIPRFEDDPKARYLDELVISRAGKASATLRREGANKEAEPQASTERTSKALQQKKKDDQAKLRQEAALSLQNIKPGDFWATLAGRQDCSPGDQTGFIGLALVPAVATDMPADYATVLEHHLTSSPGLNPKILDRLVTAMLNHDFGTRKYALTATSRFLSEIERIVSAEIGATEWEQNCTANIPCQGDPVLAVVSSSSNTPSSTPVNVLQPVRKKKKAPPSISAPATQSPSATPESGPPKEMHQCHWRLQEGAQERCKALFETLQVRIDDESSSAEYHILMLPCLLSRKGP